MRDLPNIMSEDQYKAYIQQSYYTIRRSHRFWSGIFTDQTIEQTLMRSINAPGGLSHGRGLTESTQASFVHAIPRCIPICHSLEEFCNVHPQTSDQHRDIRTASIAKDSEDDSSFYLWVSQHSPLQYKDVDGLVDVANGIVADSLANVDKAVELGQAIAESLNGITFSDVKLKRKEKSISIKMHVQ